MLWLFPATLEDLRAAVPSWIPALASPEPRAVTNPFTKERMMETTYNPTPEADFEDSPEEEPPPFEHAQIWEPEARIGWLSLYETVLGTTLDVGDSVFADSPAFRLLCREVLCGRPGGPTVRAVPPELSEALMALRDEDIADVAEHWARRAGARLSRPFEHWSSAATTSLSDIATLAARTAARNAAWFSWEDSFDW